MWTYLVNSGIFALFFPVSSCPDFLCAHARPTVQFISHNLCMSIYCQLTSMLFCFCRKRKRKRRRNERKGEKKKSWQPAVHLTERKTYRWTCLTMLSGSQSSRSHNCSTPDSPMAGQHRTFSSAPTLFLAGEVLNRPIVKSDRSLGISNVISAGINHFMTVISPRIIDYETGVEGKERTIQQNIF